jgi:hypothetical protein
MSLEVKIVGFDKASEALATEVDLPVDAFQRAKAIAKVPETDPDLLGSYPLDESQVRRIAELAHLPIDPGAYAYFLEAYEQ